MGFLDFNFDVCWRFVVNEVRGVGLPEAWGLPFRLTRGFSLIFYQARIFPLFV
jgi:hypothetical protein